jgi:hypothetical protein
MRSGGVSKPMTQMAVGIAVGFMGYILLRFSGVPPETCAAAVFGMMFALLIGWPIGTLVGYLLSRDSEVDTKAYRVVAWGNIVAWVIPVVGMTLSTATYQFSKRSDTSRHLYSIMAWIGAVLAAANAGFGAGYANYQNRGGLARMELNRASGNAGTVTGERSFERCPFAAREAWSKEHVEKHCRRLPEEWRVRAMERSLNEQASRSSTD